MRAVLHDDVDRDALDDAAVKLGWQLVNVVGAAPGRPEQLIFAAREGHVYLVNDERLGVRYLQLEGDERLLETARSALHCYDTTDHHALCASDDVATIARGLALAVLQPDETSEAAIARALGSPVREVRRAAFVAATYAPSPVLASAFEGMRDHDPDPELRAGAARWLATVCA